jgi:cytochrome b561
MTMSARYTTVAIGLHWSVAALMIFMVLFGENLMEAGEDSAATFFPSLHVSLGVAIFVLSTLRLVWRLMNPPPPLPATMRAWEIVLARATYAAFYVLTIGVPIVGWLALPELLAEEPRMAGISVFGLAVPEAPSVALDAHELHELGSNLALLLIVVHVLAALKHQFVDRDGLLRRMSPH